MRSSTVTVSVIMPAHNAEKYIARAIESVLEQQVSLELLVIDDCSTDRTASVVEEYSRQEKSPVRLIVNRTKQGVAGARNVGIGQAQGEYIAFLDADDWWEPDKLKKQLALMDARHALLCATGRELMNSDGSPLGRTIGIPEEITYEMMLRTNVIPCSSVVIKTEVAREFGMCHDELHEDYILWLSVLKKYGKAYGLNEPLLKCRLSEGGKSRNKLKSARMQYGVYRYMGFGVAKSLFYFVQYAWNGIRKYYG